MARALTTQQRQKKRDRDNRYYASEKGQANRKRKLVALALSRQQQRSTAPGWPPNESRTGGDWAR